MQSGFKIFIHERIVSTSGNDSFDVEIIKGNIPMLDKTQATFDLSAISENETRVTFTMNFMAKPAFMWPLIKIIMSGMLRKMLVGLKYHLKTDKQVTSSNIKGLWKFAEKRAFIKSAQPTAVA